MSLFALKDCFEAGVKFLGSVLVAEYLGGSALTPERDEVQLEKMVRPSLGTGSTRSAGSRPSGTARVSGRRCF